MRLVNPNSENPYYVGKCKNNIPPKHVLAEGVTIKQAKIDGNAVELRKSPKSNDYIYIKAKAADGTDEWLWVKDATIFEQTDLKTVAPAEKPAKAPKEKKAKGNAKTEEDNSIDLKGKYNVYGTEMTGAEAKKRFGAKNIKDGLASGKVTLLEASAPPAGATGDQAAAAETGTA